jgi:hypothetical protein
MASKATCDARLDGLLDQLRRAPRITRGLMSDIMAGTGRRAATSDRIGRLIDGEAWTEAALMLVELELPQWKLRRLVYDDSVWLCSLSKQCNVPDWLSDAVEGRHGALPLAILCALIAARQWGEPAATSVPQCRIGSDFENMCCDNFA